MATFVMAGGGTGGHVVPALAVACELASRGHQPHFIGTQRGLEARLVPAAGFPIDWIEIGGLNRVGIAKTLGTLRDLPVSVLRSAKILSRLQPSAVFSMGGYVAGPVLLAALWKRIPIVAMEPNAIPGLTHRRLASRLTKALVTFPETAGWFPKGRTEVTGLPVRPEFFHLPPKRREGPLAVLITGGSQGSRTLNTAAAASWSLWKEGEVALIHQTGKSAYEELSAQFKKTRVFGEIAPFFDDMAQAFARADIVVSRSGMGAVSELAAAGKPSILVPFPFAADDHQTHNAQAMVAAGAARLVPDSEMTGERLVQEIRELDRAPEALENMAAAARKLARPDAARRAAEVLESCR